MKVLHISPTYFDPDSVIGGGERYPTELATSMSTRTPTTLLSFSRKKKSMNRGRLQVELIQPHGFFKGEKINPRALIPLALIRSHDVIHIHHISTFFSDLCALAARALQKKVWATDYGGGSGFTINRFIRTHRAYTGVVAYSSRVEPP